MKCKKYSLYVWAHNFKFIMSSSLLHTQQTYVFQSRLYSVNFSRLYYLAKYLYAILAFVHINQIIYSLICKLSALYPMNSLSFNIT